MRGFRLLLWPAGLVLGLAGEWAFYGWGDPGHWLPDLLAGLTLIACGLLGWSRRPESRSGPLMAATGFAWFAPNFQTSGLVSVAWLSGHALYLYRGPLVQLVLTYPRGRLRSRLDGAAVSVGYAAAVVTPVGQSEMATIVLAGLLVVVAGRGYLDAVGRERRARLAAWQATTVLAVILAGTAAVFLAVSSPAAIDATRFTYRVLLCVFAVALLAGLIESPWERRQMGDLVVELGEASSDRLRDALAQALGDPKLEVGYWSPETAAYVDAAGELLELPSAADDRSITRIGRAGEAVAILVHDRAVLDDPGLVAAVAAASRLAASNARLQAEVRGRVTELESARRRLVEAGDEARRQLEQRLHEGPDRRLRAIPNVLVHARADASTSQQTLAKIQRAETQLEHTLAELGELARGLHPRALTEHGLARALHSLARESPMLIDLNVPESRLPGQVEAAVYFVCSEAVTNVAKYASASRVKVLVAARDGAVRVEIADDGIGGADLDRGTGLSGLVDRVEALGGRLRVESPPGSGTRVTAEIPLG